MEFWGDLALFAINGMPSPRVECPDLKVEIFRDFRC